MATRHVVIATAFAIVTTATSARADDAHDRAFALASEATDKAAAGDLDGAIELYKAAIALDAQPSYLCNVGVAYYKLERWPQAHLIFSQCLENASTLEAERVSVVSQAYAFTEKQLGAGPFGQVAFDVEPAGATVSVSAFAPDEVFAAPRTIWLPAGEHQAVVSSPGHATQTITVRVVASDTTSADATLERAPAGDDDDDGGPPADDDEGDDDDDLLGPGPHGPEQPGSRRGSSRRGAYIAFGVGAAALIGGVVFHVLALDTVGELENLSDGATRNDKIDELHLETGFMYGLYATSAVAAGVGVYLWRKAGRSRDSVAVGATPGAGGGVVWLRWHR